jgi:hypothetical protein
MVAMTKIKSWDEIPEFKTEDEEREFWETHSISAQLANDFNRPAQGPMARKMRTIAPLKLDEDTSQRLVELSLLKQVDPQDLVMHFIVERIYEEEKRAGVFGQDH